MKWNEQNFKPIKLCVCVTTKFKFLLCIRRGPVRYRFQGLYELDSLAVVNVRDAGANKNAFKILMFPDSKMYQADSSKSKVCPQPFKNLWLS